MTSASYPILPQCLRCAKARCPECLVGTRYIRKGKWMVCSDHEWSPLDMALFEEQERQRKLAGDKTKRKVKVTGRGRKRGVRNLSSVGK